MHITWRKSSRSNPSGNCVELAALPGDGPAVGVRDSKHIGAGHLTMNHGDLTALLDAVRS